MLTVKDKEIDKVLGLELGADDYMTKPFSLRELMARVKAVFRRTEAGPSDPSAFSFGGIDLDFKKFEASKKGKKLELTPGVPYPEAPDRRRGGLNRDDFLDGVWEEQRRRIVPDGRQPYRQYPEEGRGRPLETAAHPQRPGDRLQVRGMKAVAWEYHDVLILPEHIRRRGAL
jgi:hypothetical protein